MLTKFDEDVPLHVFGYRGLHFERVSITEGDAEILIVIERALAFVTVSHIAPCFDVLTASPAGRRRTRRAMLRAAMRRPTA